MKRILTLVLTLVMGLTLLTGCDPVADELETFVNDNMGTVYANTQAMKDEVAKWETYETEAEMIAGIKDVIIPKVTASIELIDKAELKTDEVKALRDKCKKALETYKAGFEDIVSALESGDADAATAAMQKISDANTYLEEYNAELEKLAEEKEMKIEY